MTTDPATWNSASETPDMAAEIDSLEDLLREVASEELKAITPDARMLILPVVSRVAKEGIRRAMKCGLLHDQDSATYTPKFREAMARILSEIWNSENPRLQIDCIDYVLQLGIRLGMSQTKIAEDYNITRACVSKKCRKFIARERYTMPPGRGMKSEKACSVFVKRQLGKRAKPLPEKWNGGADLKAAFNTGPRS